MKRIVPVLTALILFITASGFAHALQFKTHVSEFNVTGDPNENLTQTLQGILSSRLNPDLVQLVEKPEQADLLVIASYAQFGKMFSLDVLIKNRGNGSLVKVFEQGESREDVIPALGRLAQKINAELAKIPVPSTSTLSPAASQPTGKDNYIIVPPAQDLTGNWSSAPLDGVFSSIAIGRTLSSGERELFIAGEQTLRAYRKGTELRLIAEITIPSPGKILAIDTADLDRDGSPELYVTIIDRGSPSSRVYQFDGTAFVMIAKDLPWFFRGIGHDPASRTIYTQEIDRDGRYYGDVKELSKSQSVFTTGTALKLPRSGNIFNFIRLSGASGKEIFVILDEDGHLVTYSPDGSEAWKSSEEYGGSETFFTKKSQSRSRSTQDLDRWTFLAQRFLQLKDGTLIVPRNEGALSFGNIRSYDKHTLFAFELNGAILKEKWHTRQLPGYLADYAFDQTSGEVLRLEVVQKPGMFNKGKTVISINSVD